MFEPDTKVAGIILEALEGYEHLYGRAPAYIVVDDLSLFLAALGCSDTKAGTVAFLYGVEVRVNPYMERGKYGLVDRQGAYLGGGSYVPA
jgi:hypothetical protein